MTPEETKFVFDIATNLYNVAVTATDRWSKALRERMEKPRLGDLVIDIFTADWDPGRLGRLSRVEQVGEEKWWVIAPLHTPGVERKWEGAHYEFIALPSDGQSWVPA